MTTHPTHEQLSAYHLGQLLPDQAEAIENHLSQCDPCCETVVSLSADDTFVGRLKEAGNLTANQTLATDQPGRPPLESTDIIPEPLIKHPRYEIVGLIGKGGMGQVYKARHRMMDRTVALKLIHRRWIRKPEVIDRFHREVQTAASLDHPNIVTSHDAEQVDGLHFLVMEYVDGIDLSETVNQRGPLPIAEACDYIRQAAEGLQYAHQRGMVHRDIKPHNLMVTGDKVVKILDFGLASLTPQTTPEDPISKDEGGNLTIAGAIMGTPDFISPEQAQNAHMVDGRSDLYSLGMTLYYLLSGRQPFDEGSALEKLKLHVESEPRGLETLRDDIPPGLLQVVSKMIAKDPGDRFQSPAEVAVALQPFTLSAAGKTIGQQAESVSESGAESLTQDNRPPRRPRGWIMAAGASLAAALILLFASTSQETVADKLTELKTPTLAQFPQHLKFEHEVAAAWYNVEGKALGGNTAAICDFGNCRIALLGQDITESRDCIAKHYLRVSGPLDKTQGIYSDEELERRESGGKPYFWNDYSNGVASCRFYDFRFTLTDKLIRIGKFQHVWNDPSSPGLLILVDTVSGRITTQAMKPQAERGTVGGLIVLGPTDSGNVSKPSEPSGMASKLELSQDVAENLIEDQRIDSAKFADELFATISRSAGIPNDQWEKTGRGMGTDAIEGTPLSKLLLMAAPANDTTAGTTSIAFAYQTRGNRIPKPSELHDAMALSWPYGYVSLIQPDYISRATLDFDREAGEFKGTVWFEAPDLYSGKVDFAMIYHVGRMKVKAFALPEMGVKLLLDQRGWSRSTAQAAGQPTSLSSPTNPVGELAGATAEKQRQSPATANSAKSIANAAKRLAHLRFNGQAKDFADAGSTIVVNHPQFQDGCLVLNGETRRLSDEVFRVKTPGLQYDSFAVAIRFKAESLDGAILCGGPLHRWMVIEQPRNKNLTIRFGLFEFETVRIETGKWYDLVCSYDRQSTTVRICLNGVELEPMQIGKKKFHVENSPHEQTAKEWVFRNPENAYTFHGRIDEFIIFDRALTTEESLSLTLGDETPKD